MPLVGEGCQDPDVLPPGHSAGRPAAAGRLAVGGARSRPARAPDFPVPPGGRPCRRAYRGAMRLRVEFTTEPFDLDEAPAHALVAREVLQAADLDAVDVGPFGNTAEGGADAVLAAVESLLRRALGAGATRVSLQVNVMGERDPGAAVHGGAVADGAAVAGGGVATEHGHGRGNAHGSGNGSGDAHGSGDGRGRREGER
ncbi:hypothetical protein SCWH03_36910 [Streptomyces pacificus]|uniref:Thiamine-binding protein domain-containing protein n=1 Tax=Streptomyces pacificus TaxID=2705029 RepID=A0A6A0AYH2_9ACTN|nr:hypothetical protein SCWH03_36910 [Streptomyces pacificus]